MREVIEHLVCNGYRRRIEESSAHKKAEVMETLEICPKHSEVPEGLALIFERVDIKTAQMQNEFAIDFGQRAGQDKKRLDFYERLKRRSKACLSIQMFTCREFCHSVDSSQSL